MKRGDIIKVKRGKIAKRAYVLDTLEAIGILWVEYAYITHDAGTMVIGSKRHYEKAEKVALA